MSERKLPAWAQEIRNTYLRGESSVFLLHGNVHDAILHGDGALGLTDFLVDVLLKAKDVVVHYNPAIGIKFRRKERKLENLDQYLGVKEPAAALAALESLLLTQDKVGVIIDYAEMLAPAGENSFQSEADRRAVVMLHRWSLDRRFDNADNVILLVTELLSELSPKLVSNPKITTVRIPLPSAEDRRTLVQLLTPSADERSIERLSDLSAGLKNVPIRGILAPGEDAEEQLAERKNLIGRLLGDAPNAKERAEVFAKVTQGMARDEIVNLIRPGGVPAGEVTKEQASRYEEVMQLLAKKKRELLEKECFGLIEFVEPKHDLADVGGMEGVKKELMNIARNIREGNTRGVPMGLLLTGPMGSGKTFVAEAFARSSGLTAIKLKNFRSKWVGSTEGNLEKILGVVQAIGSVLVIIDEGDRSFGSEGEGDGGTSSRVMARLKEFMSDTNNRGRVLFVIMTNRPDKLDIDIKRAGRLDKKIPFFYPQEAEEVELVLKAQLRRHRIDHNLEFPRDRAGVSERLVGYSNADVEAVVLLANDLAQPVGGKVTHEVIDQAIRDYLPSRDAAMLEYMELLAVFEASSRQMLPRRYRDITPEALQERLSALRLRIPR